MDKLGMEVVEVDLRDAYAFGGGLHCCTADVYREGRLRRLLSEPLNQLHECRIRKAFSILEGAFWPLCHHDHIAPHLDYVKPRSLG
jgi:hypothetical protein